MSNLIRREQTVTRHRNCSAYHTGSPVRAVKVVPGPYQKKILVIEDHPMFSEILTRQIAGLGIQPIVAKTGEGGLRKAGEAKPDLILLDITLPDIDGLQLASLIRENPKTCRIPILAMTPFPNLKTKCLQSGCNDILEKPVKAAELVLCIKRLFRQQARKETCDV